MTNDNINPNTNPDTTLEEGLCKIDARLEEELERRKMDALAEFAAGAGHEINNPLAIISGHCQLLLREITHPEHRRQVAVIAAQAKRAYEMIADIRYFARPPAPEWERIDLVENLGRLVREQSPLMNEAGIEIRFVSDFPENTPLWIRTDAVQLHLAATFLCNNAREALVPKGGEVRLALRSGANETVEILIEDNGTGIDEEIRSLVFCPYFSGRQAGRGLGFGLPKTWRIMEQLGGSVRYEPIESGGSRFILSVPYRDYE